MGLWPQHFSKYAAAPRFIGVLMSWAATGFGRSTVNNCQSSSTGSSFARRHLVGRWWGSADERNWNSRNAFRRQPQQLTWRLLRRHASHLLAIVTPRYLGATSLRQRCRRESLHRLSAVHEVSRTASPRVVGLSHKLTIASTLLALCRPLTRCTPMGYGTPFKSQKDKKQTRICIWCQFFACHAGSIGVLLAYDTIRYDTVD